MVREYVSYQLDGVEIILSKEVLNNCSKIILNSDNTYDVKTKPIKKSIVKDEKDLDELFNIDAFRF
ncbi:hypothetical protein QYB59_000043 [Clostridium perfringens]|nr:hypothetical protein [Clostridium perfringens]